MKIDFEFETQYGKYSDAIHLPDDHTFTNEQILDMQVERLNNWIAFIERPAEPPTTVEIDGVQYEQIELNGQTVLKPIGD